jgi:hypothetical protein
MRNYGRRRTAQLSREIRIVVCDARHELSDVRDE